MNLFRWWLTLEFFGLVGLPIIAWLFPGLRDRGISLARVTGLVLVAYPVWLVSHWGEVFGTPLIIFFFFLLGVIALVLVLVEWRKWEGALRSPKELILSEIVFLTAFLVLALIRSFNPEIEGMWKGGGSEKFMDLNFVNSILNSTQFPPRDNWLASFPINYYYYGYYLAAVLIKLSGVLPQVGYNLMVVTVYALAVQGLWGLLRNLGCNWCWSLLGLYLAFFATNLKAPWLWFYPPQFGENFIPWESSRVIQSSHDRTINEYPWFSYLWGDLHGHLSGMPLQVAVLGACWGALTSLRSIGAVRQFLAALFLSLLYGTLVVTNAWDLPAFGAVILASLLAGYTLRAYAKAILKGLVLFALALPIAAIGTTRLGISPLLSLAVLLIGGCLLLFLSFRAPHLRDLRLAGLLVLRLCAVVAVFYLLYHPFFANFVPPTSGHVNLPWETKSPFGLWLLVFGGFLTVFAIPLAAKVIAAIRAAYRGGTETESVRGLQLTVYALLLVFWAVGILFIHGKTENTSLTLTPALLLTMLAAAGMWGIRIWLLNSEDEPELFEARTGERYVIFLLILGTGLVLGCEFVAVRDFYGGDSTRLNTVFKFHLQGWLLYSVAGAFLCNWLAAKRSSFDAKQGTAGDGSLQLNPRILTALKVIQIAFVVVVVLWTAVGSWALLKVKCSGFSTSPTLDGIAYALPSEPGKERPGGDTEMSTDDANAILWLLDLQRFEFDPKRLILEAPGDPYSIYGRVSAFSGIPTLIGVPNHERIWNGKKEDADRAREQREREAETIYRTNDFRRSKELLEKYGVTHVFWGTVERKKYGASAEQKFKKYMKEVKSFGDTTIYSGFLNVPIEPTPQLQEVPPQPLAGVRVIQDPAHALDQPRGVSIGKDGTMYVCNSKAGRIDCFSQEGTWLRSIGTPGQIPNSGELSPEWSGVGGVTVGDDGTLYVADTWQHRIAIFNPDGSYQREIKASFWGPRNLILSENELIVADTGNHRVVILSKEGNVLRITGEKGEGSGQLVEPVGLAVHQDKIFVADTGNRRVQVFGRDSLPKYSFDVLGWDDQVGTEPYLAIDALPSIWLTDSRNNRLERFTLEGKMLAIYGPAASPAGSLLQCKGLAWFNGSLIISDFGKNRLIVWPTPQ